jgi:FKBP-type peptidyl-prolyl cis-trans isomerase FkpA
MKRISVLTGILMMGLCWNAANAQGKKSKSKESAVTPRAEDKKDADEDVTVSDGFKRRPSGLEYKIVTHGNGNRKPQVNDHIELNIHITEGDSVLFDSRKMNNNMPVPLPVAPPKFKGDVMEGFGLMVAGDSAIFRVSVDTFKKAGMPLPPWSKAGEYVQYQVVLISVRSDDEEKKAQAEKAEQQKGIDDKLLQDYFAKNNIKPLKTASGLYYTIEKEGTGEKIKSGLSVTVNYTGMFIDGKKFDSNTDPEFKHTTPFDLEVGVGHVIKGWDEGLQLLKKGSKATLYIPSVLAYGSMGRGQQMPPNAILIFEVEVLKVVTEEEKKKEAEEKQKAAQADAAKQNAIDDKLLQDYFAKNNIKATKTASGMYYVITQKGLCENAKPGKKVTMNYTGKLLDGTVFDSNTDPAKGHVQPFTFTLGQGMVIKGWDEGVQLLKLGSRGTFYIPSSLGYGSQGAGASIPANAVLVFDVEVTGIDK